MPQGKLKFLFLLHAIPTIFAIPFLGNLKESEKELLPSYDYVVIGGGTSGLVVANRLSENSRTTVLVLEAGEPDQGEDIVRLQRYLGGTMHSKYDWNVTTVPQVFLNNTSQYLPIGKVLGGSSVLNGMMFDRGSPTDYDSWEALGNKGWGWGGLLPYFKKSENFTIPTSEQVKTFGITWDPSVHGFEGYIHSGFPNFIYPQNKNFQRALNSMGILSVKDQAQRALNHFWSPNSIDPDTQTRSYARNYFDKVQSRTNLHVLTSRHVTKLVTKTRFDGVQIIGVEFAKNKQSPKQVIKATKEVILAAGAVHTPQVLQLSGIGEKSLLEKLGIEVVIDLPGVGQNYQDHPYASLNLFLQHVELSPIDLERNATLNAEMKELFYSSRQGPWTAGSPNSVAFLPMRTFTNRSREIIEKYLSQKAADHLRPGLDPRVVAGFEAQRHILLSALATPRMAAMEFIWLAGANRLIQMPFFVVVQHPFSRGYIEINSTDPWANPVIDFRTGSNPVDLDLYVEGLKFARKVVATDAIQDLLPREDAPGPMVQTDEDLKAYLRRTISTMFHPSGTAAMMKRKLGGVVSDKLMVYGTTNLRIIDASILPLIPATHLQSTVYAVAEKAADIIKAAKYY